MLPFAYRVNVSAAFPTQVVGKEGVEVSRGNGIYSIGSAYETLATLGAIPTPAQKLVKVYDNVTGVYNTLPLSVLPSGSAGTGWVNTRVFATANYTALSTDAGATISLGGGAFFMLTVGAATGYPANCIFVISNEDTTRGKSIAINGYSPFILWPGQSFTLFNQSNTWRFQPLDRWALSGDITIFLDTALGNDSNDGLAAGSTGALKTFARAIIMYLRLIDFRRRNVTLQVAAGQTWTESPGLIGAWVGGGTLILDGGGSTFSSTTGNAIVFNSGLGSNQINVRNLTVTTTGSGINGISVTGGKVFLLDGMVFGPCIGPQIVASGGAFITPANNYTITGGAQYHVYADALSCIDFFIPLTVTLTGTPPFLGAFAAAVYSGVVYIPGFTFSGAAAGPRYISQYNGVIFTNTAGSATYFPGNSAGSTTFGGQYQ